MTYSKEKKYKDFEALFRANYTRLYFYAFNLVNDQECAEDIVGDTFSYLWENYDTVVGDVSPLPLLYSLVRNSCIDHLRHCDVKSRYASNISQNAKQWEENSDDEEHQERISQVMSAINQLPPQTRKVFEACFLHGKKYKEVAEEMGITVNTVKTLISRALSFVRNKTEK